MKEAVFLTVALLHCTTVAFPQNSRLDSLSTLISGATDLDEKGKLLVQRSKSYPTTVTDKSLADAQQALAYYQQTENAEGQVDAYVQVAGIYSRQAKYKLALDFDSTAYGIAKKAGYKKGMALSVRGMGRNSLALGKLERARDYMLQSLQMLLELNELRDASDLHNQLGIVYRRLSDIKRSLHHFDEGIVLAKKTNHELIHAYLLMNKANTLNEASRHDEALQLHLESIKLKEKLKDERGLIQSYNNTSILYKVMKEYDEAISYLLKANGLAKKTGNKTSLANSFSNLADVYRIVGRTDSVATLYETAIGLFRETGEDQGLGMVCHNYGHFLMDEGNLEKAEVYLDLALTLRQKVKSNHDIASTLNIIGVLLSKKGKHAEAEQNLLKALAIVKGDNQSIEKDIYQSLAGHYRQTGQLEEAYQYQASYISLHDTLVDDNEITNMLKQQNQYELDKKEVALQLSNKEKEIATLQVKQKNTQLYFIIGAAVLLGLLLFAAMQAYNRKRKHSQALEDKNTQIETLIRELHHRVKNNLQVVSGLLALQSNRIDDDKAKEAMDEGRNRVDAMAMVHQKLYMDKDLASVDIHEYLDELTSSLAGSFGYERKNIETRISLPRTSMDIDRAIPIGLIVNELVTNAFKHAFDHTIQPKIEVSLANSADGEIQLKISDNGKGSATADAKTNSFGLRLVHTLVEQLNGKLEQYQENGTVYRIQIRA